MALQESETRRAQRRRPADTGMAALKQAARRLGELAGPSPGKGRTRDLVGMLLAHGSRAWRAAQPAVSVRLRVEAADGRAAVRLALD